MTTRAGCYKWGTNHTVSYTSTSVPNSTAFHPGTNKIRVIATTGCHLAFGSTPVATTSSPRLVANQPEYIVVAPGSKIAAIRTTTSGTLHVTEVGG